MVRRAHHALFCFSLILFTYCQGKDPFVVIQKDSGNLRIKVEVADSPEKRARGLMFRKILPDGEGMIFLFPKETQGSFWMKNTPISLDLFFIRQGMIVDEIERAIPNSERLLTPDSPYDQVLEVPGGYGARQGIHRGDSVTSP